MFTRKLILALCLTAGSALALQAQTTTAEPKAAQPQTAQSATAQTAKPAAAATPSTVDGGEPKWIRPETPEQRKLRIGTVEDPGPDPDPAKRFWRFGHMYYIEKADRRWANFDNPPMEGWVRPFGFVNFYRELYQMNDKWVWVWQPDRTDPSNQLPPELSEPAQPEAYTPQQIDYVTKIRSEFTPLTLPSADTVVRFEESSQGLPAAGSWRNSVSVADMNEDGCPDIVAPSERGVPNGVPAIFLGDCKGHWTFWREVKWPRSLDYGSVVAVDINKDGHLDLVFGVHLTGIVAFLGDGKGHFTDASADLPTDFPTRRVVVADVDHDGSPDIVALSEGPTPRDQSPKEAYGRLRVYYNRYNREKGPKWEGANVDGPNQYFGGDWLSVGNFNDDKYPDFVAASIYFNGPNVVYASTGPKKYVNVGGDGKLIPYYSYLYANTTGHFTSKRLDDAIVSFVRIWPTTIDQKQIPPPAINTLSGLDRITFTGKEPVRTPIARWPGGRGVWGMATGDFDGDGNLDLIYTHGDPRGITLLLGDGKGGFREAKIEGLKVQPNTNYDIKVADVNKDGVPDVIIAYESTNTTMLAARDGSIHVYLGRGATRGAAAAQKTADTKQ
jgi:hypothetical protein